MTIHRKTVLTGMNKNKKHWLNLLIIFAGLSLLCLISCAKGKGPIRALVDHSRKLLVLDQEKCKDCALKPYVVNGETYYPLPDSEGFVEVGQASWYGRKFHGKVTSSGEIYDMHKKTAAHKTLPLGTYVQATNLSNNKQTTVKINDRGPFVKGRIIDLSYAAGKEIGLIGPGVAKVKIVALGKQVGEIESSLGPKPVVEVNNLSSGEYTVQVGAFKEKENALRLGDRLKVIFGYVEISVYKEENEAPLYRLWVSKSSTLDEALDMEKKLENMGFEKAFIISL